MRVTFSIKRHLVYDILTCPFEKCLVLRHFNYNFNSPYYSKCNLFFMQKFIYLKCVQYMPLKKAPAYLKQVDMPFRLSRFPVAW